MHRGGAYSILLFLILSFLHLPTVFAETVKDRPAQATPDLEIKNLNPSYSVHSSEELTQGTKATYLFPEPLKENLNPSDDYKPYSTERQGINSQIINTSSSIETHYKNNETALKAVEKSLLLYTNRLRNTFKIWLERSGKYIDIMRNILKERGLPEELVFLPIIESGFNPHAYSPARAVGPWQFISETAKRYGLIIDWWRDERKDPVKSTQAAASYLKDLYRMFGSWNLSLAAYNAGEGRILRSLKKSGENDYWALIERNIIPKETREYVPRYIAAKKIIQNPEEYGFYNLVYHEPLEFDEVIINSPIDIDLVAKCAETTESVIRELNPELRRWSTPPGVPYYKIRIPKGTKEIFFENLKNVPKNKWFSYDTYKVKKGDTLKKISKKTGYPVSVILALNSISGVEKLKAGTLIKIPPKDKYVPDRDDKIAKRVSYKKGIKKKVATPKKKPKRA